MIKNMFKGITKRWLFNTFSVVLAIIVLLVVCLCVSVRSLCYGTVESALNSRSEELSSVFPGYTAESTSTFLDSAMIYASSFEYKDEMEIEVINAAGRVVLTSTGFNIVHVQNGTISVHDADCHDRICVKSAPISQSGEIIACLPHKLLIEIKSSDK